MNSSRIGALINHFLDFVKLWNRHTVDRWVRDVSDLGKMDPEKVKRMNKKLKNSKPQSSSFIHVAEWYKIMLAI